MVGFPAVCIASPKDLQNVALDDVRVLLAVEPTLFGDVLRETILRDPTITLVGETSGQVDLLVAVRRTGANVVVLTWPESGDAPSICSHLLLEYPELLVIGISMSGRVVACRQTISVSELPVTGRHNLASEICRAAMNAEEIRA